ncbi:hypothetical protein L0152_01025, partial [bacterium]|nr:hypothetical protein [bacterium]
MSVINIFSKRKKKESQTAPDVFIYDRLPGELRVQIVHIILDCIGKENHSRDTMQLYKSIRDMLCREYGVFYLAEKYAELMSEDLFQFILQEQQVERVLDAIELTFRLIHTYIR